MKQRCKNREEKNLLPFHIIKAASEGDVLAINTCGDCVPLGQTKTRRYDKSLRQYGRLLSDQGR